MVFNFQKMFYKNYLKFLDSILRCFSDDYNNSKSVDDLKQFVFKNVLSKGYDINKPDKNLKRITEEVFTYTDYLKYGIEFLKQEGLITYDDTKRDSEKSVRITSKGFNKIKTEGFYKKSKNDKINVWLQRSVWFSALATLCITLYTQFIRTKSDCICNTLYKTSTDCNHNIQSYPTPSKFHKQYSLKDSLQEYK